MKKLLFGLLISISLLSACNASDISVEPLLNNVYDAVNQSLWVSGASVNGTDISVENLTANGTINVTGTDERISGTTGYIDFNDLGDYNISFGNSILNCLQSETGTSINNNLILSNTAPANATNTTQYSPALAFSGYGNGASNSSHSLQFYLAPSGTSNAATFNMRHTIDGSTAVTPVNYNTLNGFTIAATNMTNASAWNNTMELFLSSASTANSTREQGSSIIKWAASGWKTNETPSAISCYMFQGLMPNANQTVGTLSPVGVHRTSYSIGSTSASWAKELLRYQFGNDTGVTGVYFNYLNLTDYKFQINSNLTLPISGISAPTGTDKDLNGTASVIGTNTTLLGAPSTWINMTINGTNYKIPAY